MSLAVKCALCLCEKDLMESHVIPEFLYKMVYDRDHSFFSLSTAQDEPIKRHRKGIYERLLCSDCERQIGRDEDYFAKVLNGGTLISVRQFPEKVVIGHLDYSHVKLFQMSLLWRAHVSRDRAFRNVDLGPHGETMRTMILARQPGKQHQYGCLIFFSSSTRQLMQRAIFPFERLSKKLAGVTVYRTMLAGLMWAYVVSNRTHLFPHQHALLQENGELAIYNSGELGDRFVYGLAKDFKKSGRLDEVIQRKQK